MTNAKVYQGFHDDKKVEENWRSAESIFVIGLQAYRFRWIHHDYNVQMCIMSSLWDQTGFCTKRDRWIRVV